MPQVLLAYPGSCATIISQAVIVWVAMGILLVTAIAAANLWDDLMAEMANANSSAAEEIALNLRAAEHSETPRLAKAGVIVSATVCKCLTCLSIANDHCIVQLTIIACCLANAVFRAAETIYQLCLCVFPS